MSAEEIVSIFQNPSIGLVTSEVTDPALDEQYAEEPLIIEDVHFTPGVMIFENAYEGKTFHKKLVIQNCGDRCHHVRMGASSAGAFKFQSFRKGYVLSPGLKIVRTVTFAYQGALAVPSAFATATVDGKSVDYKFLVRLAAAVISLEPRILDFGRVDAVAAATVRTLTIRNTGSKGAHFLIDLGRNELELIVDPMKGTVHAQSSVVLSVEIVGQTEGRFMEEFWIKTTPPQSFIVQGVFISPKLVVRKFISALDFTLHDFRRIYFGSRRTRPLLIKNYSSMDSMYFIMAEIKGKAVPLHEARKIDDNYCHFIICPEDGRMAADKGSAVQITFAPRKHVTRDRNFTVCFLKIIRIDCRDIKHNALQDENRKLTATPKEQETTKSNDQSMSIGNIFASQTSSFFDNLCQQNESDEISTLSFESSIKICLHGEKESAEVSIRPDLLVLNDLTVSDNYDRVLYIENKSEVLPIIVKYVKVPGIEVVPDQFELLSKKGMEVRVMVRATKIGLVKNLIAFDLMCYDLPLDSYVLRKVGHACIRIEYDTKNVARAAKNRRCCVDLDFPSQDLRLRLEPELPFRMTESLLEKRKAIENYYTAFIRKNLVDRQMVEEALALLTSDYDLSDSRQIMQKTCPCQDVAKVTLKPPAPYPFIPLRPKYLFNVKITPKSIRLRKIAAFTSTTESFTIENQNTFPIRVLVLSSKPCVSFASKSRHIIEGGETRKVYFVFSSSSNGRYNVNLDVIINESAVYQVTAVALVIPKTLNITKDNIVFRENDPQFFIFEVTNNLNTVTAFDWEVPGGCFKVFPTEGCVFAERALTCMVTLLPDPGQANAAEGCVTSESGHKRIVQFSYKKKPPSVIFDSYDVDLGIIPLNRLVQRKIVMHNVRNYRVWFSIPNGVPVPGIKVVPKEGFLNGKDSQVFVISVLLDAVIQFATKFTFNLDDYLDVDIKIKGIVDYPLIKITPEMLFFRKMSPYSFDRIVFKIQNLSKCECEIAFPLDSYAELTITDNEMNHQPHIGKVTLRPREARVLYLHCHPFYVATSSMYLPFVINDLIGPPYVNSSRSCTTKYFLEANEAVYAHLENVQAIWEGIPSHLPSIRINSCATNKVVEFSHMTIDFLYFGEDHYNNTNTCNLDITNTSPDPIAVCIRIDDLGPPFGLEPGDDLEVTRYEVSYVVSIQPGVKVTFKATFSPEELGDYEVRLPIFLRHYPEGKVFNFLSLRGSYATPSITPSVDTVFFEPIPLTVRSRAHMSLKMSNHFANCELSFKAEFPGMHVIFEDGDRSKIGDVTVDLLLSYTARKPAFFDSVVNFFCTCESWCSVRIKGTAQNNFLLMHSFSHTLRMSDPSQTLKSIIDQAKRRNSASSVMLIRPHYFETYIHLNNTCYPFFPANEDTSEYACHMRNVCRTVENWVYSQGFYCKLFYRIPDGFVDFCEVTEIKKFAYSAAPKESPTLPLVQLIRNLAGGNTKLREFSQGPMPEAGLEYVAYVLKTYTSILQYFNDLNFLHPTTIKAQYLLNHEQWLLYKRMKQQSPEFDQAHFYRYSKQCWLDMILLVAHVFVLSRVPTEEEDHRRERLARLSSSEFNGDEADEDPDGYQYGDISHLGLYGPHEQFLLKWLEGHYQAMRADLWRDEGPDHKELMFYYEDLRDGLVLAAVTASYCPYVGQRLEDMYTFPNSPEQYFHNACRLVQAWGLLKFSFAITPHNLVASNGVELLLLVAYLYDVLPQCQVSDTITINAKLTQTRDAYVEVQNCGQSPIVYTVAFFDNPDHLFTVLEKECIKVQPGKKKKVRIQYHAKKIWKVKSILLLSGETHGYTYGTSIAVALEGVPDNTYAHIEMPLKVGLYKITNTDFDMEAPFSVPARYSLCVGVESIDKTEFSEINLYPMEELNALKLIREYVFDAEIGHFEDDGFRSTQAKVCCLSPETRNIWLYFTNPTVGDWAMKIILDAKVVDANFETIKVMIPKNYDSITCLCKKNVSLLHKCPKIVHIKIPCMNNLLWTALKNMILEYVGEEEYEFWKHRIFTPTGTRMLTLIFNSETHAAATRIETSLEYTIFPGKGCPFKTLKQIAIEDVISKGSIELPIHFTGTVEELIGTTSMIRLVAIGNVERRFYKLLYKYEEK